MRSRALHRPLAVVVALVCLAGCAPPAETPAPAEAQPAVDLAAAEQAIRDSSMQWLAAEQGRDLLTVMSFMDANVTTIFDGRVDRGRAAVETTKQAMWQEEPDGALQWTTESVVIAASGDLAYERGAWIYDADGEGPEPAENGEFVTVWSGAGGEWKVVVDAGSTIK